MPSFASLTAVLALTSSAISSPLEKRSGFSLQQVETRKVLKNGPAQVIKTFRKYGKPVPQGLIDAATTHAATMAAFAVNGSDPATPIDQYDSAYICNGTIGSTVLNLDLDTGSSDLWVYSSLQPESQRKDHRYYKVDSAKVKQDFSWNITYGDGSHASGKVYADKVDIAGVTFPSQAVEAAETVSDEFLQNPDMDGFVGLAFSSLNTVNPEQQKTFFENVMPQLPKPIFAVDLQYHSAGTYDFGFLNQSKYTGELTYINANNSQGFWGFESTGYSIGEHKTVSETFQGIFDTGTTLIFAHDTIAAAYYKKVKGSKIDNSQGGYYTFPCRNKTPDFSIVVGGVSQKIPGKYMNYSPTSQNGDICFGGLQANTGLGMSIFGDIFLKSKYVVHEGGSSPRIGLGQQPN